MRPKIITLILFLLTTAMLYGQSFPVVIVNSDQGGQTLGTLGIYANQIGPANLLTRFNVNAKLVAVAPLAAGTSVLGSDLTSTASYWHVDIPGTSGPRMGYVAAGSTFSNPDCGSNYIHINSTSLPLTTTFAGSTNITISGIPAKVYAGQNFAVKSTRPVGAVIYYEIYLTIECSAATGWVSGAGGSVQIGTSAGISKPVLTSSKYTGASVTLDWSMAVQPSGLVPTNFDIYRSANGAAATVIKTQITDSYTDNSLTGTNAYSYYIVARYANCSSETSNALTVGPLTPACNLSVSISGSNSINCGQTISLTATPSVSGVSYSWAGPNNFSSGAAFITIANAANVNAGSYSVTVSKSGCNNGSTQQPVSVNGCSTPVCTSYPATPTGVAATTVSSSQINLSWPAVSGAASYRIYDCAGTLLTSTSSLSYPFTGLTANSTHNYKVTALNSQGCESQNPSACQSATTTSVITPPTLYAITGKVRTAGGVAVAGVKVATSLPAPQYSALTDANGDYTISNIPNSYSGTVSASLANYTFSPATLPVSGIDDAGKDFIGALVNPPVTITLNSGTVAPWQRAGEDYQVSLKATTSNNSNWTITAYNDAVPVQTVTSGSFASGQVGVFSFRFPNPGRTVTYSIQSVSANAVSNQLDKSNYKTVIIDQKWDKPNYIYHNKASKNINIPLLWYPNAGYVSISFYRLDNTHNPCGFASGSCDPKYNYLVKGNTAITQYPAAANGGNRYFVIDRNSPAFNLQTTEPGVFGYKLQYFENAQKLYIEESNSFELAKTGEINHVQGTHRIAVFIGGWNNTIEHDINDINSTSRSNDQSFSLTKYDQWEANGFKTWYIALPNLNYTQRNAYDIGMALDSMLKIEASNNNTISEINLIVHSKGGLDTRALLGNLAISYKDFSFPFNNSNIANPSTWNFQCLPLIKRITFLATPHDGKVDIWSWLGAHNPIFDASPAIREMSKINGYGIVNYMNKNATIPNGIAVANLTAYQQTTRGIFSTASFNFTDGIVSGESSDCVSGDPSVSPNYPLKYASGIAVPVLQMYQHTEFSFPASSGHILIHRNLYLDRRLPSVYALVNSTVGLYSNLDKIILFNNGTATGIPTCPRPTISRFMASVIKSKLSGAKVSIKFKSQPDYSAIGITDFNGNYKGALIPELAFWDSVKVEANGIETVRGSIGNLIANTGKLNMAMFKSAIPSARVQYPAISLPAQNDITGQNNIQIKVTGENVKDFQINQHNSETLFIPLSLSNSLAAIPLDTGYNKIIIRYIGVDTVSLFKNIFYFPGNLMQEFGQNLTVNVPAQFKNVKLFADQVFYKELNAGNGNVTILNGTSQIGFSRYGYRDTSFHLDSLYHIDLSMQPYSYSSLTDSSIYDFNSKINPQYWKNVTLKNTSAASSVQVSAKQYDDIFKGMGLKPASRKFVFRNLTGNEAQLRTAIALDQAETPDVDSVYLLSVKNGKYTKYEANRAGVSEYDPEVQKLAFDSLALEANESQEIVLMKKQAPIALDPGRLTLAECQSQGIPASTFVKDPDSLKNDVSITPLSDGVTFKNNMVSFTRSAGHTGPFTFKLALTHDFLTVEKTYTVDLTPCPVVPANTFTPNGDGINDTWNIPELSNFSNCTVDIFVRGGSRVFHSDGYGKAWDGTYGGKALPTGVYYYIIDLKAPGYTKVDGYITIIR